MIVKKIIFKIKPKFNKKIIFLRLLSFHVFISLWWGFFSTIISHKITNKLDSVYFGFGSGMIIFILFPIVTLLYYECHYSKTSYNVYEDRIEYKKGFINLKNKKIFFKDIAEIDLKINVTENEDELGNILLVKRNDVKSHKKNEKLYIKDIPNSIFVYKKLSDLVF